MDNLQIDLAEIEHGNVQNFLKEWSTRRREPCAVCELPVFIAQRLRVGGRLYHRTCFRCGRCGAQLNPADSYETCAGEWVCETCPDEMPVPEGEEERLPPSPPVSPPPDPPPSLVAARRLMFDTDDAKLMKQDHHAVNTARLVHSIKKDLSSCVDTRSQIDSERTKPVNITVDKNSTLNPEADDSVKDSNTLVQCVNKPTIPVSSNRFEQARDPITEKIGPPLKEDDSVKLVVKKPLVISDDTPSFNAGNKLNVEQFSLHSKSDDVDKPIEVIPSIQIDSEQTEENTPPSTKNEIEETTHSFEEMTSSVTVSDKEVEDTSMSVSINNDEETMPSITVTTTEEEKQPSSQTNEIVETFNAEIEVPTEQLESTPEEVVKKSKPSDYPGDLNPFGDSEEEEENMKPVKKVSTNPFGSESEEEEEQIPIRPPPRAVPRKMSLSQRSTASTNPFGSDEEDEEETPPVPKSRTQVESSPEPTPFPRRSKLRTSNRSISSLTSIGSYSSTSPRKKKPAPPPPTNQSLGGLTPSSRQASMSSLVSIRSRKTKRAPLPPSPAGLPPLPKSPPPSLEATPPAKPPRLLELSSPSVTPEKTQADTTGEMALQIEEGMQKLIEGHRDFDEVQTVPLPSKEEKDSINETSKAGGNAVVENISDEKTVDCKVNLEEITFIDKENEINKSVFEEKNIEGPVVIVNKEEISLDDSCDKVIDNFGEIKLDDKTGPVVEAYNEDILTSSRDSTVIKFDEISPPLHSTPVKIIPSATLLESSTEDVASGNSMNEISYLSSPSASCADTSSYQESLASPPMEKRYKDSANMHKKITESGVYVPHKSIYGQWKRKKGPAPALPIPQRRNVTPMPMNRIRQELGDIEIKQQELERQGVALEQKIRSKFDSDTSITPYLDELVRQLFDLVNEKNELFRKQAELMYLRRQHQLEEEHAELEYQIRLLMARPEVNKTDSDKELEEKLIQRLVEVVERRDAIVQCLEMDRLREVEEDKSINRQLDKFTKAMVTDDRMKITKKHKKKKEKHNTLKMLDLDKDFDESEKDTRKKKKWYTLHHHKGTKHM